MKAWLRSNRGFLVFLAGFLFFRTAVADWNPVPSGSMRPTILEGDVVFVERIAYDWKLPLTDVSLFRVANPQRGDVVVFSSPRDGTRLIKRIVAVPGDEVEVRNDVLVINGQPATYSAPQWLEETVAPGVHLPAVREVEELLGQRRLVQQLPGVASRRNFGPLKLATDEFFMMGDNRNNSEDSRAIGPVPRRLITGQARRLLVSADITAHWAPRWERFGAALR
ncbi:signal peptidase I [Roseateles sp. YR242]|uniref:signal peptidase I n=1 Tax=Roseateles sp. YR242 TaxID=1855305 RepID=UPI000B81BD8C|nr:signal peptidase I [Roseateles sp. YR242]